jgi:hypothetical protein
MLVCLALCIVALLGITACAAGPIWQPDMGTVSNSQLDALLKSTDASELREVPVSEALERRNDTLAALRREQGGSEVADVVTEAFPQDTAGVPLFVGVATYSGEKTIVLVEAYGARGGNLDHKRLWVLSMDGTPRLSTSAK